jgi:GT2 family glycosyltransferase
MSTIVDVVVVAYNSADHIRPTVEPLTRESWVRVFVVDNASTDDGLARVADLDLVAISKEHNDGFAAGCNVGWRAGESPYVMFLNPDAKIDIPSLRRLGEVLDGTPGIGVVAPRIVRTDGSLQHSLRRYPRLTTTFAQALFLHKLFPRAVWADEKVRAPEAYERAGAHEWVSGACLLARRDVLEQIGGWDAGFFLYCEDIDLCKRVSTAGYGVRYEPSAVVVHDGGGSAPRAELLPHLAASRVRYARLHRGGLGSLAERAGIALEAMTHMLLSRGGRSARVGHARSLGVTLALRS